jgi:hypothetical protein
MLTTINVFLSYEELTTLEQRASSQITSLADAAQRFSYFIESSPEIQIPTTLLEPI